MCEVTDEDGLIAFGPSVCEAKPALYMHSVQTPPGAAGGTGFPQCGQVFSSAIILFSSHTKEELAKGYGKLPEEIIKRPNHTRANDPNYDRISQNEQLLGIHPMAGPGTDLSSISLTTE
jgi:hypothetical protein